MESDSEMLKQILDASRLQVIAQCASVVRSHLQDEAAKSPDLPILAGHKVYSQNDEDGITLEIFSRIGIKHKTFFEIGVGNGMENNTLFWLKQGWKGVWIDGSDSNAEFINRYFAHAMEEGNLTFRQAMIRVENIDAIVETTEFSGQEIDLLSIDIDGNDYYIFQKLSTLNPRLVIIEYNSKYPPPVKWRIPYDREYVWNGSDWFGASLCTMSELFEKKGYTLVGCNMTGSNAFYVRNDLLGDYFPFAGDVKKLYQPPRYYLTTAYYFPIAGHGASNQLDWEE